MCQGREKREFKELAGELASIFRFRVAHGGVLEGGEIPTWGICKLRRKSRRRNRSIENSSKEEP